MLAKTWNTYISVTKNGTKTINLSVKSLMIRFLLKTFSFDCVNAIWHQRLKNGVQMVCHNAVLTSYNAFEWLSQESVSLNLFSWHSNSYLTFNHLHGMEMTLEWNANGISGKTSCCPIGKVS